MTSTLNRDAVLSTLSNAAYEDKPPENIGNWKLITPSDPSSSGFFAVAYINDVTKEVVVSYRGTDNLFGGDAAADKSFVTGNWHAQFEDAAAFTAKVMADRYIAPKLKDGQYTLLTTGHSLGGGIAQLMAQMFNINGASFDAPGANKVASSAGFLLAKARYAPGNSNQIGSDFYNYTSNGSMISAAGSHLGQEISIINLADASPIPFIIGLVSVMSGGAAVALLGFAGSTSILDTHLMNGIERALYIAAGLEKALNDGSFKMATVPLSQATGKPWTGLGKEPNVVVFQNTDKKTIAIVERTGDIWKLYTPNESTVITLTPSTTPNQPPTCIIKEVDKPAYSCTMEQSENTVTLLKDTNLDGKVDSITSIKYVDGYTSETKIDNNADGSWDRFDYGYDSNRDGRIDQHISTGNSFADLLNADRQMRYLYGQGSVLDSVWRDYSSFSTYQLVYSSPTFTTPTYHFGYDPIGAFYESKAIATDNAASIAKQTFRILDGNGKAISAAQLMARDNNKDGKLSGAELDGLTAWQDGNEDGVAQAGESMTLASALSGLGLQAIRASDVGFYTAGQAVGQTVAQSTALAPLNIKMPPLLPTAWGSNYAALRDKEKFYAVPYGSGGIIFWEPGQIRVSNDQKNMIGTDNNDSFDINYYAQYNGKFFNLALIQNFYAGGGDDLMGGSDRSDNLWGGTGNDILWGYAGDDRLYGEEGNDELDGGAGNDLLDGGSGNDLLFGQDGNDTLIGGEGQDELIGGNGHDVLDGGNGNDKLFGGVGNDVLNGGDGDDFLQGFTAGNDPKKSLLAGETDDDVLFGGTGNDQLFGGFGNDYLDGGIGQDYLSGGDGDDTLFGGAGDDELNGDSGNDVMDGGSGADKMFGGVGNDRMWGRDGDDIMMGFTAINEAKQTLLAGETDDDVMYGGAGNDLMIGGLGNDQLWGGTGNDELQGGEGDDWLYGEAGNDRLFGGAGDDVIYGGDGDDLIIGGVANTEAALLAGARDNNFLYGGAGNDTIIGGIGNDYIDGGAGADSMEGGKGNDTYIVNSVNDVVLEQQNEGYDTVISSVNYILNANIEELRLLEGYTINGTGNSLDNRIIGNSQDNILDGVTGADTMIGGLGDDIYYVDNTGDQVVELAGEGVDTVYASISYALGEHVENLTLLDFSKPEKGIADGVDILVYGYPKANELDYMQGNAIPGFRGTCALTSIANLATQANIALTEGQVVQRAIDNSWCVTDPVKTDYQRGGSNFHNQQALLDSYGIRNGIIAGYNEQAIANLIKGGRGVMIAVNSGKLWNDPTYLDDGSTNHVVTVTGVACNTSNGEINGFYIADSGRGLVSDMTRYIPLADFRRDANVTNAYSIYTIEPIKLWEENINATGNALDNLIIGNRGDNVLTGGKGNDTLIGQAGNDRYVFNRGDGQDLIIDQDATAGNTDTLQLNGLKQTDLWFSKQGMDLQIQVLGSTDRLTVKDWYVAGSSGADNQIERIQTATDGRTLYNSDVAQLVQAMSAFAPPSATQTNWVDGQRSNGQVLLAVNH